MAHRVGVDVGGSGVRAGWVDERGVVHDVRAAPLSDRSVDSVCAAIEGAVAPLGAQSVGVGVPGFVRAGRVVASPNFPEWRDVALADRLGAQLGVPVALVNDANAAALGRWWQRGAQGDLVLLTLGTGVGGGVVTDGRLLEGLKGTAAELGHLPIGGDARCGCGGTGCLETLASTVGLIRMARAAGHEVSDGAEVLRRADDGEDWAIAVCDRAADALGQGLIAFANLFAPDEIAIAGGLSRAAHRWTRAVQVFEAGVIEANRCPVVFLGRADELAIAGAARRAFQETAT